MKFVLMFWINNILALVQIMTRHRPGHQQLSEPRMVSLLTHICVTLSQWVNGWHNWLHALVLHLAFPYTLRWRHNERDSVSNHQPHDCLLNGLFRRRSKKTSKLRVTGLCAGNSPGPVNYPHKGPVTRKMFPFDDVIMIWYVFILGGLCRYVYSRFVPSGVTISYSELTCVFEFFWCSPGFSDNTSSNWKSECRIVTSSHWSLVWYFRTHNIEAELSLFLQNFPAGNFQAYFDNWWLVYLMWNCSQTSLDFTDASQRLSINGLVSSGVTKSQWVKLSFFNSHSSGSPFTNMDELYSQHGEVITSIVMCGMKLLIHSQTSTVEVWEWISNFIPHFLGMWLLMHGIKVKPYYYRGPVVFSVFLRQRFLLKLKIGAPRNDSLFGQWSGLLGCTTMKRKCCHFDEIIVHPEVNISPK